MNNIRFLIGDYAEKRKYLRSADNYAYADNDEVDGVVRIKGKDYFFLSEHPFGDFTALQYVSYCRALKNFEPMTKKHLKNLCSALGIKLRPDKKLRKYSILSRRLISLVANYKLGCELRINLDGYGYTRGRKKLLKKMLGKLARLSKVTVSVSDTRFVFKGATTEYIRCGYVFSSASRFRSRFVSRRRIAKLIKVASDNMPVPKAKAVVCCSPT